MTPRDIGDQLAALGRYWDDTIPPVGADEIVPRVGRPDLRAVPGHVNGRDQAGTDVDHVPVLLHLESPRVRRYRRTHAVQLVAGLATAAAAVVGLVVVAGRDIQTGGSVSAPTSPDRTEDAEPLFDGSERPLDPGTYVLGDVQGERITPIHLTVGEGWSTIDGWAIVKGDGQMVTFSRPEQVYVDACELEAGVRSRSEVSTLDGLVSALRRQRGWTDVSAPVATDVDGHPGWRFERTVPEDLSGCTGRFTSWDGAAGASFYPAGDTESVLVVDLHGWLVVVEARVNAAAPSTAGAEMAAVLDSVGATEPAGSAAAVPDGTTAIEPGTYRVPPSPWSAVPFTVTFPDGWEVQYGHLFRKHPETDDEFGFYAMSVDDIFADACGSDRSTLAVGPTTEDLADALTAQVGPAVTRTETTLGGFPAIALTMTVPDDLDLSTCRLGDFGLQVWYGEPPVDHYFVVHPDGPSTVYLVDVDGRRQVFVTRVRADTAAADLEELQGILDTIRFDP